MGFRFNGRWYDEGYYTRPRPVKIIGRRTSVTTVNDIWPNGTAQDGNMTIQAGVTLGISSGSASDTSAGTGARTVVVVGVDTSGIQRTVTLTLNGQTKVTDTSGYSFVAVNLAYVATWGSGLANAGKIYIYDSTDTVTTGENATIAKRLSIIDTSMNVSQTGFYTVPTIGNDVCDLLITGVHTLSMDATTTVKYAEYNMLVNYFRFNGISLGLAGKATWFDIDFGTHSSSSSPIQWPPPQVGECLVVLNGGTLRTQVTASAALGTAAGIDVFGLLVARAA